MIRSLLLSAISLAIPFHSASAQQDLPPAVKEYAPFITYYYTNPQQEKARKMLVEIIQKENLEHPWYKGREFVFQLMAANLGDIGYGQEEQIRFYQSQFAGALPGGKRIIIRALQTCGDKESLAQAKLWLADEANADVKPELTSLVKHLADPKRQRSRDKAPQSPPELDYLWGDFFSSGEYAPISRILDVFDLPDESKHAGLKQAARFSTQSNFQQHPKLVELVKTKLDKRPAGSKRAVEEMLEAIKSK